MTRTSILWRLGGVVALLLWIGGCSQSLMMQGRQSLEQHKYQSAIDLFYQEISLNPDNPHAWRELGYAYYKKADLTKAEDALKQSSHIKQDARTHVYLGLVYEKRQEYDQAVTAYTTSLSLKSRGRWASETRRHLDRLLAKRLEVEVSQVLASEDQISADTIPDNTIAVSTFDAALLAPEMAPIALGLAEFTAIDLAKVRALTVVERQKMNVIMKELELGAGGYLDPATAPRMGRLMGAARLVTGTVVGVGDEGLKLNGAIVATLDGATAQPEGVEGEVKKFFRIQKDFVFKVLEELGISLSEAEREAIRETPTKSYLAFLAFSRGLYFESRGMYDEAGREYQAAVGHDASFAEATQHLNTVTNLASAGSYEEAFTQFEGAVEQERGRQAATSGPDSRLTAVARNSGTIPQSSGSSPTLQPPVTDATVTVSIQGDLDAP